MPPRKKSNVPRQRTYFAEWRNFRRMLQYEAAEKMGIEPSTLGRIENGKSPYDQITLEAAAKVYSCEPGDLISTNPLKDEQFLEMVRLLKSASHEQQAKIEGVLNVLLKP